MSARSILLALVLSPFAVACAASDAAPPPPEAPPAVAAATSPAPPPSPCVLVMTRARACTAQWIPALVDARARLDIPAGIADAVRSDRPGVLAAANAEWATDSQDAGIARTCARVAASVPAADQHAAAMCLAKTSCDDFVACAMPVVARHLAHP